MIIASAMSETPTSRILRALWPFLVAVAGVLILLSYFPVLSTVLID